MTQPILPLEERIIGALVQRGAEAAHEASTYITQDDFVDPELGLLYDAISSLVFMRCPVKPKEIARLLQKNESQLEKYIALRALPFDAQSVIKTSGGRISDILSRYSQQAHCFDFSSDCRTLRDESRQRTAAPGNAIHTRPNNVRDVPNRPKDGLLPPEFGGPELTFIPKAAYGRDKRYHTGKAMLQIEAGEEETSLIRGLLRQQSVNFLFGEEGSGKSLLAMNLAISVATGASRFLEFDICTHGKTLYLNNELPFREFLARFKTMAEALPEQQAERLTQLLVPENVPQFESYWDEINELCRTEKPALVVLDCLYWSHNRGENNSSGMKAILRQFTSLRDAHKLALLILHHTNKGSRYRGLHNNNMRGSGVFGAASDTTLELRRSEKDETKRLFKPTKLRYNNDAMRSPRLLSLADNSLWFVDNGAADEDEHIAKAQTSKEEINLTEIVQQGETLTREEILKRCMAMGFSERTVDRNLKQAKKTGLLKSPRKGVYVG